MLECWKIYNSQKRVCYDASAQQNDAMVIQLDWTVGASIDNPDSWDYNETE